MFIYKKIILLLIGQKCLSRSRLPAHGCEKMKMNQSGLTNHSIKSDGQHALNVVDMN